jgi:type II secretory pathway component PulJ
MHRTAAFTLIEVLAVVLLTALVLGIALDFYVDLSRAGNRAADHTRGVRRATAILDRMARDFEAAVLVRKPDDVDPLAHPWVFLAESEYSSTGADHIKFVTRNHRPRSTGSHESDLAVVSYTVQRSEDDALELRRWSSPRLPEGLDRSFPSDSDDAAALLADGIASFGVALVDEAGGRSTRWDSSQLVESSELPMAVEIEVAMLSDDGSEPVPYRRRVLIPVRPLDLEALLDPEGAGAVGEDDDEAGADDEEQVADGRDGRAAGAAGGEPELESVPTVAYCIDTRAAGRVILGPRKDEMQRILAPHLNDPISMHSAFIRSNGYKGLLRANCLPFL